MVVLVQELVQDRRNREEPVKDAEVLAQVSESRLPDVDGQISGNGRPIRCPTLGCSGLSMGPKRRWR